jgi:hypothetical protein
MKNDSYPVFRFRGSPAEVGFQHGQVLEATLAQNYAIYMDGLIGARLIDMAQVRQNAIAWLLSLPKHFQEELKGVSEGAGVPLPMMSECQYASYAMTEEATRRCSSVVGRLDGDVWIGHNNDWFDFGSHRWTSAVIREIPGRIPTLVFGLQGDVCTVVGTNRDRLWLQMNGFPAPDSPARDRPSIPSPFLIREALETCQSLGEVECLLHAWDRSDGMGLYAVEGRTGEFALFECTASEVVRRDPRNDRILASCTRDLTIREFPGRSAILGTNLARRLDRLMALWERAPGRMPDDMISILADAGIEDRREQNGTLYSNVACPTRALLWFAAGSFPAASTATWRQIEWPWT